MLYEYQRKVINMGRLEEKVKNGEYVDIADGDEKFLWDTDQEKKLLKTSTSLFSDPKDHLIELFSIVYNTDPSAVKVKAKTGRIDIIGDGEGFSMNNINELMSVLFANPDSDSEIIKKYGSLATAIFSSFNNNVEKIVLETSKNDKPIRYWVTKFKPDKATKKDITLSLRFGDNSFRFGHDDKSSINEGLMISIYKNEAKKSIFDLFKKKKFPELSVLSDYGYKSTIPILFNDQKINTHWTTLETMYQSNYATNRLRDFFIEFKDSECTGKIWLDSRSTGSETYLRSGLSFGRDNLGSIIRGRDLEMMGLNILIDSPYFELTMGKNRVFKGENVSFIITKFDKYKSLLIKKIVDDFYDFYFKDIPNDMALDGKKRMTELESLKKDILHEEQVMLTVEGTQASAPKRHKYYSKKLLNTLRDYLLDNINNDDLPDILYQRRFIDNDALNKIIKIPIVRDLNDNLYSLQELINPDSKNTRYITTKSQFRVVNEKVKDKVLYLDKGVEEIFKKCNVVTQDYDSVIDEINAKASEIREQERLDALIKFKEKQNIVKNEKKRQRSKLELLVKKIFGKPVEDDLSVKEIFKDLGTKGVGYTAMLGGLLVASPVILTVAGIYYTAKGGVYVTKKVGGGALSIAKQGIDYSVDTVGSVLSSGKEVVVNSAKKTKGFYSGKISPKIHRVYYPVRDFTGRQFTKAGNAITKSKNATSDAISDSFNWTTDKVKTGGSYVGKGFVYVFESGAHLFAKGFKAVASGYKGTTSYLSKGRKNASDKIPRLAQGTKKIWPSEKAKALEEKVSSLFKRKHNKYTNKDADVHQNVGGAAYVDGSDADYNNEKKGIISSLYSSIFKKKDKDEIPGQEAETSAEKDAGPGKKGIISRSLIKGVGIIGKGFGYVGTGFGFLGNGLKKYSAGAYTAYSKRKEKLDKSLGRVESKFKAWIDDMSKSKAERKEMKRKKKSDELQLNFDQGEKTRSEMFVDGNNILESYKLMNDTFGKTIKFLPLADINIIITPFLPHDYSNEFRVKNMVNKAGTIKNSAITYRKRWNALRYHTYNIGDEHGFNVFNCFWKVNDPIKKTIMDVDLRDEQLAALGDIASTRKGRYAIAPFLIEHLEDKVTNDRKKIRYSYKQPEMLTDNDSFFRQGYIKAQKLSFQNEVPYSEIILSYYSSIINKLKNERVNNTLEYYDKNNEEKFKKSFDLLNEKEVRKVIGEIFKDRQSMPTLDAYIESKYADIVSQVGRSGIAS